MKYSAMPGIVLCAALITSACKEAENVVISGPPVVSRQSTLWCLSFPAETMGWAAGDSGRIYRSTDGGETWFPQASPTTDRLLGSCFIDTFNGWMVGSNGRVLHTTNGGDDWTAQNSGTTSELGSVYFVTSTKGWIVGGGGIILKTTNAGYEWTAQNSGTFHYLYSIFFAGSNTGWAVGNIGVALKTTDSGNSWNATFVSDQRLQSITFVDSLTGWIAGSLGALVHTSNGGRTWDVAGVTTGSLVYVSFVDRQTGWAVGQNGPVTVILKTTNGGSSWSERSINALFEAHAAAFRLGALGWIVGSGGKLIRTTDGGLHWNPVVISSREINPPVVPH